MSTVVMMLDCIYLTDVVWYDMIWYRCSRLLPRCIVPNHYNNEQQLDHHSQLHHRIEAQLLNSFLSRDRQILLDDLGPSLRFYMIGY